MYVHETEIYKPSLCMGLYAIDCCVHDRHTYIYEHGQTRYSIPVCNTNIAILATQDHLSYVRNVCVVHLSKADQVI